MYFFLSYGKQLLENGVYKHMKNKFLLCGSIGWCMEIFWTGIHCLGQNDFTLMGHSSIWMFPIYGLAAVIGPVSRYLKDFPTLWRGSIYTVGIYLRIHHRLPADQTTDMSLGLQPGGSQLQRADPAGLRPFMVPGRTFFRENSFR